MICLIKKSLLFFLFSFCCYLKWPTKRNLPMIFFLSRLVGFLFTSVYAHHIIFSFTQKTTTNKQKNCRTIANKSTVSLSFLYKPIQAKFEFKPAHRVSNGHTRRRRDSEGKSLLLTPIPHDPGACAGSHDVHTHNTFHRNNCRV